jgi:predicted enzyme related to lactoylglutathione lyase
MADKHGRFCWYELMTTDAAGAKRFYGAVTGWSFEDLGPADAPYVRLMAGEVGAGGLLPLTPEMQAGGARPAWVGYIAVDDVDAYAKKVTEAGGAIYKAPADIPGVGRFAMAADPGGAAFVLFKPSIDGPALPHLPAEAGLFQWRELMAENGEAAFAFYSKLFGWKKGEAHDMGPMGLYQLFTDGKSDDAIGGMMTKPPFVPRPVWNYYVRVESVTAAAARAKAAGGTVNNGPMQVPDGNWVFQGLDPQGAQCNFISATA